jgi:hypothetical protein
MLPRSTASGPGCRARQPVHQAADRTPTQSAALAHDWRSTAQSGEARPGFIAGARFATVGGVLYRRFATGSYHKLSLLHIRRIRGSSPPPWARFSSSPPPFAPPQPAQHARRLTARSTSMPLRPAHASTTRFYQCWYASTTSTRASASPTATGDTASRQPPDTALPRQLRPGRPQIRSPIPFSSLNGAEIDARLRAETETLARLRAETETLTRLRAETETLARLRAETETLARLRAETETLARLRAETEPESGQP